MKYEIRGVQIGSSYSREEDNLIIPVQVVVGIEGAITGQYGNAEYICNISYTASVKDTAEDIEKAIPAYVNQWVVDNFPSDK